MASYKLDTEILPEGVDILQIQMTLMRIVVRYNMH